LTVSEVNKYIKRTLESDPIIANVTVKGEISNFKMHSSGHCYFTLKDRDSKINCVMFRSDAMNCDIALDDGIEVEAEGRISVYEKDGRYQLYVRVMKRVGMGNLQMQFEKLKQELLLLGYFDPARKKKIPKYIDRVGIVTSPTGAAIRDVFSVSQRRNNKVQLDIYPVRVQGDSSAEEIVQGINYFNETKDVDLIIITRGGGSLEELWSFNERVVADAIYRSEIPVISGVGHEVDFTISDFTADMRAPTPSAAAELAIISMNEMRTELLTSSENLTRKIENRIRMEQERLLRTVDNIENGFDRFFIGLRNELVNGAEKMDSLSPLSTLKRGYSVVSLDDKVVDSVHTLAVEDEIDIRFNDGEAKAKIVELKEFSDG